MDGNVRRVGMFTLLGKRWREEGKGNDMIQVAFLIKQEGGWCIRNRVVFFFACI